MTGISMKPEKRKQDKKTVQFLDTTLRDGEQTPGISLSLGEKIKIAEALEELGIDIIEAGFAASSEGESEAVKKISSQIRGCAVSSLARCVQSDIEVALRALESAANPRVHIFIATSPLHMAHKLGMSESEVLEKAVRSVEYAKRFCGEIEFSPEDATRSDFNFLCRVLEEVIAAGAGIVNIPDTVGYSTPQEFAALIKNIRSKVKNIGGVKISVHCHNDLGLAVANSLAAVSAGAEIIEGTVNGIGERGGNAALEEIMMTLKTRENFYRKSFRADTRHIAAASKLVSMLSGIEIPVTKPVVGANAFRHSSGIHQHGVLRDRSTYEIMTPESIGLAGNDGIVLGKRSGRHAFAEKLSGFGIRLDEASITAAFELFKQTADRKRDIGDMDVLAIANQFLSSVPGRYELDSFSIQSSNDKKAMAMITLLERSGDSVETYSEAAVGTGPVDAAFNAINRIIHHTDITLEAYNIKAATEGADALGVVDVRILRGGEIYKGIGVSTDIIEASVRAYINAVNNSFV